MENYLSANDPFLDSTFETGRASDTGDLIERLVEILAIWQCGTYTSVHSWTRIEAWAHGDLVRIIRTNGFDCRLEGIGKLDNHIGA